MSRVVPWDQQGCEVCRRQSIIGAMPPLIRENVGDHSSLHRCTACGTYWLKTERYAVALDPDDLPAGYRGAREAVVDDAVASDGADPGSADADRTRYFVRYRNDHGAVVPFALLRRRMQEGIAVDEVLRDVGVWGPDRHGTVDRAIRFPLDSDLDEVDAARAREFTGMVADRVYRPFAPARPHAQRD